MMRRALAAFAVSLCAAATPLGAQPLEDVTMALPAVGFPFTAGYVADGLGLWEKNGLRVKCIVVAGVGSTNAVISGSADFGQISGLSLTRAAAKGQRLLALVNTFDKPFVEISIRKEIADAAGFDPNAPLAKRAQILKGHTFAVGGINSVVHAYLRVVALIGELDPETIRVTAMAGDNMLAAMQTKAIDGISTVLPWPRKPVVEGTAVLVASGSRNDPPHLVPLAFNVLATKPETCERRRSLCEKMGRTFSEAMAYIRDNPQGLFALLKKQFSNFDDAAADGCRAGRSAGERRQFQYRSEIDEPGREAEVLRWAVYRRLCEVNQALEVAGRRNERSCRGRLHRRLQRLFPHGMDQRADRIDESAANQKYKSPDQIIDLPSEFRCRLAQHLRFSEDDCSQEQDDRDCGCQNCDQLVHPGLPG